MIAAKQGRKLLAPVLYQCSTTALWVNEWLEDHLLKVLEKNSTLIMDNACFHKKEIIQVLEAQRPKGRPRKLDWEALKSDIEKHPDKLLRERAKEFGVWPNSIWYACRCLGVTHKKNFPVQGKRL